jgi:hypothetical protein
MGKWTAGVAQALVQLCCAQEMVRIMPTLGVGESFGSAKEMLEFAKKGFEYGRDNGSGSTLIGFFQENIELN